MTSYFQGFFILCGLMLVLNSYAQSSISVYEINSDKTYIQANLEQEIYYYSRDAQLRDLQIQDAHGNSLPFRLIDLTDQFSALEKETPAIFFPVAPNTSEVTLRDLGKMSIQIDDSQVRVDIHRSPAELTNPIENPDFYLIDLAGYQKRLGSTKNLKLTSLILDWDQQNSYQTWELSASNDLSNWRMLSETNLVKLEKEGQSLIKNQIPLNIDLHNYTYLKLRCVEKCQNLRISQMKIREELKDIFHPAKTQWTLNGERSNSQKPIKLNPTDNWKSHIAWDFKRDDHALIETLSINLGSQIYSDKVRLLGRYRKQDPWQLIYQGVWFNAKVGEEWYSSNPINLYQNNYPEFRLELAGNLLEAIQPALVLTTQTRAVQFIGNQTPPYHLVVQDQVSSVTQEQILEGLLKGHSVQWNYHKWTFLNPPTPEIGMVISWRSLVFWAFLLLALVVLAYLAINLFRQMNVKKD